MPPRGSGIVINIGANGTEAKEVLTMVREQLRETGAEAKHAGEEFGLSGEEITRMLERIGIVIGIREATEAIKEMIASSVELGMELGHVSKETGITAQDLSVLKFASDVTGVSFEALTKGTGRLSKAMLEAEEGKKTSIQSFERLGISQQQVMEHSNDMLGMLGIVADRFQTLPDGPQKAAVAISLFGKAGMGLIPFLDQGAAGIEKLRSEANALGIVLDEQGIARLEEMHRTGVEAQAAMQGLALSLTNVLSPALMGTAELAEKAIAKLREMLDMGHDNENAGTGVKLPAGLMGLEGADLDAVRVRAATARDAAKAKLDALEESQKKEGGSIEAFNKKKLALEKEYYDQEKTMYAAMFVDQKDAVARAQDQLAAAQKNRSVIGSFLGGDQELDAAKEKVADAVRLRGELGAKMAEADAKLAEAKKSGNGLTLQDQSGAKAKSTDGIARAAAALAAAQAEAVARVMKDADDSALVANEAWHKLMLISDEEFYAEKLRLEMQSIDAEETALRAKRGELQGLLAKQQGDKLLKRDKSGQSAEELTTKRELLQIDGQINKLETDRTKLQINNSLELQLHAQQDKLAILKIAAQIETETNTTITARLALMRAENALAIQKAGADSPEAAQLQALERVKEAKLQIADVDRQIRDIEQSNKDATGVLQDRANKDPRQRLAVTKEINQLNAQTAAQLKELVAQYDALAATLGGSFIQTAKNLHAEMDKLNTPNKKQDADLTKTLGDGITHMAEQISSATLSGRDSFHQMTQSIERDLIELAIKLAAQKWLMPMLNGIGGSSSGGSPGSGDLGNFGLPGFANGGDPTGPSIVGEDGPELFFPKGPGTVKPSSMLSSIAEGGGGRAPVTNINLTNASSQPVTARQTGSSFDADTKSYMTHVILEDLSQGGPISSALRPGG
jgi:hypothetical protein